MNEDPEPLIRNGTVQVVCTTDFTLPYLQVFFYRRIFCEPRIPDVGNEIFFISVNLLEPGFFHEVTGNCSAQESFFTGRTYIWQAQYGFVRIVCSSGYRIPTTITPILGNAIMNKNTSCSRYVESIILPLNNFNDRTEISSKEF